MAVVAASVRSETSSFSIMLLTWFLTVLSLMPSARPNRTDRPGMLFGAAKSLMHSSEVVAYEIAETP
jgi:hypothetical protein